MRQLRSFLDSPEAPAIGVALALLAAFAWFALRGGGFEIGVWGLGGIAACLLLATIVIGAGGLPRRPTRRESVALALFAGLAVWALASSFWARVPGDAWAGADRMLLYAAIFALVLILPWGRVSALTLLAGYVMVIALIALISLVRARDGDVSFFLSGRLSFPVGYPNATAALFLSGYWVAVILATRRGVALFVRAPLLGVAAALPQVALLSQSRGSLVAFPLTALLVTVLVPGRIRTVCGIAGTLVPVALMWTDLVAVRDGIRAGGQAAASSMTNPLRGVVVAAVVFTILGAIWAVLDERVKLSRRVERRIEIAAAALAAGAVVIAVVVVATSSPVARVERGWNDFTAVSSGGGLGFGLGSNRYDFWRVGLNQFRGSPVVGIGADNFAYEYLLDRRSDEEPTYPHSFEIQILSQLGIVGGVLALALVVFAGAAILPLRRDDDATASLAGAALAPVLYWICHASVDWFWEIPGLTAPIVALAALAMTVRSGQRASLTLARPKLVAIASASAVAVVALALPWSAARLMAHGLALWRHDPDKAYSALERAAQLDFASGAPYIAAGAIAGRRGDHRRMQSYFEKAASRDPDNWYVHLELALAASSLDKWSLALHEISRSIDLNPHEPLLRDARAQLRRGEKLDLAEYDKLFAARVVGRTS